MSVTTERPKIETERMFIRCGKPFITRSIGNEISFSTSSGAWPGYWVTTCTNTFCTSGKAWTGSFSKAIIPEIAIAKVAPITIKRCCRQKAIRFSIIFNFSMKRYCFSLLGSISSSERKVKAPSETKSSFSCRP